MSKNPFQLFAQWLGKDQVDPAILAQVDYLLTENKILREKIDRVKLTEPERQELTEKGLTLRELSTKLFNFSVNIVKPETILRWQRERVKEKHDHSDKRTPPKIKRITKEIEAEIIRIAREDEYAGYNKIVGYLQDLGVSFSHETIRKILKKHGFKPAPKRKFDTSWKKFIEIHLALMWGCDFFTHEVWTTKGKLLTYYVLVFIHLGTRRLEIVNVTTHPTMEWTIQQARNFFYDMEDCPEKANMKYLIHDKGPQFRQAFQDCINTTPNEEGVKMQSKPVGFPQMNSHCERVIQRIQNDCLNRVIIFGERMLRYALKQYQAHYNAERHHLSSDN